MLISEVKSSSERKICTIVYSTTMFHPGNCWWGFILGIFTLRLLTLNRLLEFRSCKHIISIHLISRESKASTPRSIKWKVWKHGVVKWHSLMYGPEYSSHYEMILHFPSIHCRLERKYELPISTSTRTSSKHWCTHCWEIELIFGDTNGHIRSQFSSFQVQVVACSDLLVFSSRIWDIFYRFL